MLKELFYFSRGQKIGLIVLALLIALLIAVNQFVAHFIKTSEPENDSDFIAQYEKFKNSLKDKSRSYQNYSPFDEKNNYNYQKLPEPELFTFNPNTLDSVGFVSLGLKPFIAKNILNYRKSGGKFKTASDFAKIYGISDKQFQKLQPFIIIPQESLAENVQNKDENFERKFPEKSDTIRLELNSADTADLKKLRGIGSGYAKAIVAYRQQLGGFVSVNQLLEVRNFPSETFSKIEKNFWINNENVRKIEINRANVDFMRRHPYLNFYKAKAIYELRINKKMLKTIEELQNLSEFTPEDLQKIAPYLDFKEIKRNYK